MKRFTSDQHYGHIKIIEFAGRPFASIPEMNAELIRRYNEVVNTDDKVWFLGDFALGDINQTLPIARQLRGRKEMVLGNHDRPSPCYGNKLPQQLAWARKYKAAGFRNLWFSPVLPVISIAGQTITLCHFPYRGGGDSRGAGERFPEWRMEDKGAWLLCGHVHNRWRQRGRQINVGVDAWGGYPVSEQTIAQLIEEGPADREPLPW